MKLLKPENADFFNPANGNISIIATGICELLKLNTYPIVIQFDCEDDIKFFAESVLKCKK